MDVNGHPDLQHFVVLDLAKTDLFIGFNWIRHHNPNIDWVKQTLTFDRCPDNCDRAGNTLPPIAFHQMYLRWTSPEKRPNSSPKEPSMSNFQIGLKISKTFSNHRALINSLPTDLVSIMKSNSNWMPLQSLHKKSICCT